MGKLFQWAAVMLLLVASVSAEAKQHEMEVPAYQSVAAMNGRTLTQKDMRTAIIDAAQARRWVVVGDEPGKLTLRYAPRTHVAIIQVDYDDKGFKISYVSSEDLDYEVKRGKTYIHGNYNVWLQRLTHDIKNSKVLWSVISIEG